MSTAIIVRPIANPLTAAAPAPAAAAIPKAKQIIEQTTPIQPAAACTFSCVVPHLTNEQIGLVTLSKQRWFLQTCLMQSIEPPQTTPRTLF